MSWNPAQYLKFADHRLRPALDLIGQIAVDAPDHLYDLGCGPGNITAWLRRRWPDAAITGIDNSPEMLASAAQKYPDLTWRQEDLAAWRPERPAALLYSNAALQWLDDHASLFPRLYDCLAPGGVLAVQMPRNFDRPSHTLMRETAEHGPWRDRLLPVLRHDPVCAPQDYWRMLSGSGAKLELWETDYLQPLQGEDAVLQWVLGTALRPLLALLSDSEQSLFLDAYRRKLRIAYPPEDDGTTLFPFRRLFLLATRPA